jgi:hypothetical protein
MHIRSFLALPVLLAISLCSACSSSSSSGGAGSDPSGANNDPSNHEPETGRTGDPGSAAGTPSSAPTAGPSKAHQLTVSYQGMKNDPYRNDRILYVRVRVLGVGGGEAADFPGNVGSAMVRAGKGSVVFSGVPEGRLQIDAFIDVDNSKDCSLDDFSVSFTTKDALVQDDELSFSALVTGCTVRAPRFTQ